MTLTQQRDGAANGVVRFVKTALDPANFIGRREVHEALRHGDAVEPDPARPLTGGGTLPGGARPLLVG